MLNRDCFNLEVCTWTKYRIYNTGGKCMTPNTPVSDYHFQERSAYSKLPQVPRGRNIRTK